MSSSNSSIFRHFSHGKKLFPKNIFHLPKTIKKISWVFLFYQFGWGIVTPFTSIYMMKILGSYTALGIIYFLFYFVSMIACIPFGEFIEKASKKWTLTFIFLFYTVLGPWFLILNGFFSVLMFRIYHGIIMSSLWTTADSYIREHSPKKKTSEAMGFFDSTNNLGTMLGCIAGGFLYLIFGFKIFLGVSIFTFISFLIMLFLPNKNKSFGFVKGFKAVSKTSFIFKEFKSFWANKDLVKLSWLSFLMIIASSIVGLLLPIFLYDMNENFILIGIVMAGYHVPKLFESVFSVMADKNSKKLLIIIGSVYSITFFVLLFFIKHQLLLFILSFCISFSFAIIAPATEGAITTVIPRNQIGEMSGLLRTIKMGAEALGPLIGGFISDIFGIQYVFLFGALMMTILLGSALFIKNYSNNIKDLEVGMDSEQS